MQAKDRYNLYRQHILNAVPRMLTELDRDPFSFTYGSFDREYWAWATKDFSNTDLQRAIFPLTYLYSKDFEGNQWYQNPRVLDWIKAAFGFWARTQHSNGAHDHHYPNEFSFVGVAFPLFETTEAFRLLMAQNALNGEEQAYWEKHLCKGADFLILRDELHGFISNHRMGAACGLEAVHQLFGGQKYKDRSLWLRNGVLERASANEGWPCEYNGMDPGYQTLTTYYISNYHRLTGDQEFYDKLIEPSIKLLQYFVHPDGSVGGEYGSRNCSLYFPGGIEYLAPKIPEAEAIARLMADGIQAGNSPHLNSQDIRNFVPKLSSYTQALIMTEDGAEREAAELPHGRTFERYWPEAGHFVRSTPETYTVVGVKKGGVTKVFNKAEKKMVASHGGYMLQDTQDKYYSTQMLSDATAESLMGCVGQETPLQDQRDLELNPDLFEVLHDRTMSPTKLLLFRCFTYTVGRSVVLGDWVKRNIITGRFIHRRKTATGSMKRLFRFDGDTVEVTDSLQGTQASAFKSIRAGDVFTTIYMASSKYYRHQEALEDKLSHTDLKAQADQGIRFKITPDGLV